jgi:hypothetical protein
MRLVVASYGDVVITQDRVNGYKRYIVDWKNGSKQLFSGLHYTLDDVKERTEKRISSLPI